MPRLFFGLELPETVCEGLLKVRAPIPGAKWQHRAQLHVTLLFLGQVEQSRARDICRIAREVANPPFELEVRGVGCFGSPGAPRNLWAGVSPEAPVATLHESLKLGLAPLGFEFDNRSFRAHITLARFRRHRGSVSALLNRHGEDRFGSFPVQEFVLFESTQGEAGSVYTVVERFPLGEFS